MGFPQPQGLLLNSNARGFKLFGVSRFLADKNKMINAILRINP